MIIVLKNNEEVEVTTTEEMQEIETASNTDAQEGSTVHHFDITEAEIDTVVEFLPKIYNLFVFWFLVWFTMQMLSRFRRQFIKSTNRME